MRFLRSLARNNEREWFQPRKHRYEELWKGPMTELVAALHREMKKFAPDYVQEPSRAVARIYRDTRFSKDKTPYKITFQRFCAGRASRKTAARSFTSMSIRRKWSWRRGVTCRVQTNYARCACI